MTQSEWQKVQELFNGALDLPEDERESWLAGQDVNQTVRDEVQTLLESLRRQDDLVPAEARARARTASAVPEQLSPSLQADRFGAYRLLQLAGRGGTSAVYLGERSDGLFDRKVAVKVLATVVGGEDFLRRFQNEGKLLGDLRHPNIATLLDGGLSSDGHPYLVLDWIEGERIDRYSDARKMPVGERLKLFRQVCEAVDFAHQRNVLHRDLKPANILVTAEGVVKLLDFGTAALVTGDRGATTATKTMLTPRYASPEQLRGERPGTTGDVFSLGVIFYELLTGVWPFGDPDSVFDELKRAAGDSPPAALASAVTPEAAELRSSTVWELKRELKGSLEAIVAKALAFDPSQRYASVQELMADLDRAQSGDAVTARGNRRRRPALIAVAAGAVVLSVVGAWFWREHRPQSTTRTNAKAAELLRLGEYHWNRRTREALLKAADTFRQAGEADPKNAQAFAYLADCYAILPDYQDVVDPTLADKGITAAHRAIALNPNLAMAHGALAVIYFSSRWNWKAAEPEYRAAIALDPNHALPHQRYGSALISRGRFREAEAELRRAQQLDPVSLINRINLAELWYYSRRFDLEEQELRRVLELDPNFVLAYVMLTQCKTAAGQTAEAIELARKLRTLPEAGNWCQHLPEAYARAGDRAAAMREAAACGSSPVIPATYVYLGDYSRALDVLEEYSARHNPLIPYLRVDPLYDGLRDQPRFQQLLKNAGL
jgi:serine/threonine protein kinase/cytochrome c-type biogenesis protein CcmH/NrfG